MANRVYHVHWVPGARDDLLAIAEYVRLDDELAAIRVTLAIEERAGSLRTFPERGRAVPELGREAIRGYRKRICAPWRIVYKVKGSSVIVYAVLDGRRKVAAILRQVLAERGGAPT